MKGMDIIMKKGLVLLLVLTLCFNMITPVAAATNDDAVTAHLSELELQTVEAQSEKKKINTILTTDGEHDDMASMIRYLTMANEFNTKAIVLTASNAGHHTGGDIRYPNASAVENLTETQKSYIESQITNEDGSVTVTYNQRRWTGFRWLYYYLEKYAEVYDNLKVHDQTYPTPEYLESVTKFGNIKVVGDLEEITQGSEFIKKIILENPDGEPLYIQHWGGTNTTARALKSIKEEYEGTADWDRILDKINNEVTLYMIWDNQAPTYGSYIVPNWPGIRVIVSQDCFFNFYATWTQTQRHTTATQETWFRKTWTDTIVNIGSPLTSESLIRYPFDLSNASIQQPTHKFYTEPVYNLPLTETDNFPFSTWGDSGSRNTSTNGYFYAEGDTPSYLCLVDNGLRNAEDPSWGGWGGRFVKANPDRPNEYRDVTGSGNQNNGGSSYTPVAVDVPPVNSTVLPKNWTFSRWIPDIQADYSVHAQWSVKDKYEDSNHHPKAGVMNGLDITAAAGSTVNLNGIAYDPDGDELNYKWWRYADADTHADTGTIELSDTKDAMFTVPEDAQIGDTIHLIFEVSDSESNTLYTSLKNYKRVILTVGVGIDLNKTELSLEEGEDETLFANFNPITSIETVTWTSSDESVATVNNYGFITAVGIGRTTITATLSNGISASCAVTVVEKVPDKLTLKKFIDYAEEAMQANDYKQVARTIRENFEAALMEAKMVNNNPNATNAQVVTAKNELLKWIQALDMKESNKVLLLDAITTAESCDLSDYVAKGQARFKRALENAKELFSTTVTTQEEIDEATDELNNAMLALRFKADTSILESLLNQVKLLNTAVFKEEGVNALLAAIKSAESIVDADLTKDEQVVVDNAFNNLLDAINALTLHDNTCKCNPSVTTKKVQLSKPTGLKLTAKKAKWKAVKNNNGYTLKVLRGKKVIKTVQIKKGKTSYTIPKNLLKKGKTYRFTLVAKGTGNYTNSKLAKSKALKKK